MAPRGKAPGKNSEKMKGKKRKLDEMETKENIKKEPVDFDDDELCEYEKLRLENIAMRERKFNELNLSNIASDLSNLSAQTKKTVSRRGLQSKKDNLPLEPVRKSLRLQNIDADTGLQLPEKEPTRYHIYEDQTPQRPPLTDLNLDDISDDIEACTKYFNEKVKPFTQNKKKEPPISVFGNLKTLEKSLKSLKITNERVAKVVPNRIFSMAIHPSESKLLVAAGGKWGSIGFWDVQDTTSEMHGVHVIKTHSRPINCLSFDKYDDSKLISTSYDGSVRIFDINQQKSSVLFGFPDDDASYTTYHCQIDPNCFMITLGRTGQVGMVDKRVSFESTVSEYKVFDKASPKMVSVHPLQTNYFMCPSNKGFCGIFDQRKTSKTKVMTPVTALIGHTRAISSAFFSPQTGEKVVTVSYDNKIRLFDTQNIDKNEKKPFLSLSHNNQTGRWLTTFKAEWHPNFDNVFFVGSMSQPRQIDVYTTNGDHYHLKGEDLASICSIVKCHPTQDIIVGGNSSGRVHVFM